MISSAARPCHEHFCVHWHAQSNRESVERPACSCTQRLSMQPTAECAQAGAIKAATKVAAIASVLMHIVRAIDDCGARFASTPRLATDATSTLSASLPHRPNRHTRSDSSTSAVASSPSRPRRVGSFSDALTDLIDEEASVQALLPELRGLLPTLHVSTRAQAAAAAALSRALAEPAEEPPSELVQLSKTCVTLPAGKGSPASVVQQGELLPCASVPVPLRPG
jgi:hypothetical protein